MKTSTQGNVTGSGLASPPALRDNSSMAIRFILVCLLMLSGCTRQDVAKPILGETMGTFYSVRFGERLDREAYRELQTRMQQELETINVLMSNWREDSEVSRFNAYQNTDWFAVSAPTVTVVSSALAVSAASDGAFDISLLPVIELWGFGPALPARVIPDDQQLAAAMQRVGWQRVEARIDPPALRKKVAGVVLDLSGIAKGYAVDRLSAILVEAEVRNFLVEIGGELCARGLNSHGDPWVVAVASPQASDPPALIRPGYRCVATSGDYENYFEIDGRRFTHIIDPATGWPIDNQVASVTVVADTALAADAWATALTVLGTERGRQLARDRNAAVLVVQRTAAGTLTSWRSEAFALLEYDPQPN